MIKIMCDRCGKKISDTYEDPRYRVEVDAPRDVCTMESFDLCEDCKDALVAFIKGEEGLNHD